MNTKVAAENHAKENPGRLRWRRIIGSAVRLDIALGFVVVLQGLIFGIGRGVLSGRESFLLANEFFGLAFLFGWTIVQKVESRFVAHGALVGVSSIALYIPFVVILVPGGVPALAESYATASFILMNALRILGSTAGSFCASRR